MGVDESSQSNQRKFDGPGQVSTDLSVANPEANNVHPKTKHSQPPKHIPTTGMQHTKQLPLLTEHTDDEPIYVNAKQYHAILQRREHRKILGSEDKVAAIRKRILLESRQKQAKLSGRGKGGRFISIEHPPEPSVDGQLLKSGENISPCPSTASENSSNVNFSQGMLDTMDSSNGDNSGNGYNYAKISLEEAERTCATWIVVPVATGK